eukprot:jgi/Bigna1/71455/fgenesh1_pg.15_\
MKFGDESTVTLLLVLFAPLLPGCLLHGGIGPLAVVGQLVPADAAYGLKILHPNDGLNKERVAPDLFLPEHPPFSEPLEFDTCPCAADILSKISATASLDRWLPNVSFNSSGFLEAEDKAATRTLSEESLEHIKDHWERVGQTLRDAKDPRLTESWADQGRRIENMEKILVGESQGGLLNPGIPGDILSRKLELASYMFEVDTGHRPDFKRSIARISYIEKTIYDNMRNLKNLEESKKLEESVNGGGVLAPQTTSDWRTSPPPQGPISDLLTVGDQLFVLATRITVPLNSSLMDNLLSNVGCDAANDNNRDDLPVALIEENNHKSSVKTGTVSTESGKFKRVKIVQDMSSSNKDSAENLYLRVPTIINSSSSWLRNNNEAVSRRNLERKEPMKMNVQQQQHDSRHSVDNVDNSAVVDVIDKSNDNAAVIQSFSKLSELLSSALKDGDNNPSNHERNRSSKSSSIKESSSSPSSSSKDHSQILAGHGIDNHNEDLLGGSNMLQSQESNKDKSEWKNKNNRRSSHHHANRGKDESQQRKGKSSQAQAIDEKQNSGRAKQDQSRESSQKDAAETKNKSKTHHKHLLKKGGHFNRHGRLQQSKKNAEKKEVSPLASAKSSDSSSKSENSVQATEDSKKGDADKTKKDDVQDKSTYQQLEHGSANMFPYPPFLLPDDFRWTAVAHVVCHVAQADGLAPKEKRAITMSLLTRGAPRITVIEALNGAVSQGKEIGMELKDTDALNQYFLDLRSSRKEALHMAIMAAVADNELSTIESEMLKYVAKGLGALPGELDQVLQLVKAQMSLQDVTAKILYGLEPTKSRSVVMQALVSQSI